MVHVEYGCQGSEKYWSNGCTVWEEWLGRTMMLMLTVATCEKVCDIWCLSHLYRIMADSFFDQSFLRILVISSKNRLKKLWAIDESDMESTYILP